MSCKLIEKCQISLVSRSDCILLYLDPDGRAAQAVRLLLQAQVQPGAPAQETRQLEMAR